MYLPFLSNDSKSKLQQIEFKGYNHNLTVNDGEFYDMKNLTSDYYPVLSARNKRAKIWDAMTTPNGLYSKDQLVFVDGTNLYYYFGIVGFVTDTKKQFASMGSNLIIFPDKKIFNTLTGTLSDLESKYISAANTITFTTNTIVTTGAPFDFKQYDAITISGSNNYNNNKTVIIREISMDGLTLTVDSNVFVASAETGVITFSRDVPDMDFITEHDNRLWGCNSAKHEIYACKLGDPYNWNCFEGISTDSFAVTVGTDGNFTGACTHLGYVIFMKEDAIHKIYGNKPSNYQLYSNFGRGVAKGSEKSLVVLNDVLFYKSRNDVIAYSGSATTSISEALGTINYKNAVAGALGDKYYISMQDDESIWHMFVYDYSKGIWQKEDNAHALYFAYLNGKLFYINGSNEIMTVKETDMGGMVESIIPWYAETGDINEKYIDQKRVSKVQVNVELEQGTTFEVYVQFDGGAWEKKYTIASTVKKTYNIPIIPRRCDHFRIKFSGKGGFKLFSMAKTLEYGSGV